MPGPMQTAAATLAQRLGEALAGAGFLTGGAQLEVDPAAAVELSGALSEILVAAQLFTLQTSVARTLMGSGAARYVVERTARLELSVASPDRLWRDQTLDAGLSAIAGLVAAEPTLSGAVERLELQGADADDLPPNGAKALVTVTLRVRSSDPLGLSA